MPPPTPASLPKTFCLYSHPYSVHFANARVSSVSLLHPFHWGTLKTLCLILFSTFLWYELLQEGMSRHLWKKKCFEGCNPWSSTWERLKLYLAPRDPGLPSAEWHHDKNTLCSRNICNPHPSVASHVPVNLGVVETMPKTPHSILENHSSLALSFCLSESAVHTCTSGTMVCFGEARKQRWSEAWQRSPANIQDKTEL